MKDKLFKKRLQFAVGYQLPGEMNRYDMVELIGQYRKSISEVFFAKFSRFYQNFIDRFALSGFVTSRGFRPYWLIYLLVFPNQSLFVLWEITFTKH